MITGRSGLLRSSRLSKMKLSVLSETLNGRTPTADEIVRYVQQPTCYVIDATVTDPHSFGRCSILRFVRFKNPTPLGSMCTSGRSLRFSVSEIDVKWKLNRPTS